MSESATILDMSCDSRMFWFDKDALGGYLAISEKKSTHCVMDDGLKLTLT